VPQEMIDGTAILMGIFIGIMDKEGDREHKQFIQVEGIRNGG
jgi:hypothetical protein